MNGAAAGQGKTNCCKCGLVPFQGCSVCWGLSQTLCGMNRDRGADFLPQRVALFCQTLWKSCFSLGPSWVVNTESETPDLPGKFPQPCTPTQHCSEDPQTCTRPAPKNGFYFIPELSLRRGWSSTALPSQGSVTCTNPGKQGMAKQAEAHNKEEELINSIKNRNFQSMELLESLFFRLV